MSTLYIEYNIEARKPQTSHLNQSLQSKNNQNTTNMKQTTRKMISFYNKQNTKLILLALKPLDQIVKKRSKYGGILGTADANSVVWRWAGGRGRGRCPVDGGAGGGGTAEEAASRQAEGRAKASSRHHYPSFLLLDCSWTE